MFHQGDLAGAVSLVHAADLRDGDVAFVDDGEEVLAAEVVEQGVGGLAGLAGVKVHGVVLDAGAKAHGLEHLEVVAGALLQTLGLQQLAA